MTDLVVSYAVLNGVSSQVQELNSAIEGLAGAMPHDRDPLDLTSSALTQDLKDFLQDVTKRLTALSSSVQNLGGAVEKASTSSQQTDQLIAERAQTR